MSGGIVAFEVYEQAVQGRRYFRDAYARTLRQLRELSEAAQAVLEARDEDGTVRRQPGLRYLEETLAKIRGEQ